VVSADDAAKAIKRGEKTLENIVNRNIRKVTPDTPAIEIFPILADLNYPLPVVNEQNRLLGVIIRGSLLAGLSEGIQAGGHRNGQL
jgi:glycine betaine/proline transport system ATP-binding protein